MKTKDRKIARRQRLKWISMQQCAHYSLNVKSHINIFRNVCRRGLCIVCSVLCVHRFWWCRIWNNMNTRILSCVHNRATLYACTMQCTTIHIMPNRRCARFQTKCDCFANAKQTENSIKWLLRCAYGQSKQYMWKRYWILERKR